MRILLFTAICVAAITESLGCNCEAEWEPDVSWCELNKRGFAIIAEVEIEYRRLGEKRDNSYIEVNAFIERVIKSGESLGRVPSRKPIRLQLQFTPPCTLDLTSYYRPGALLSVGGELKANVLSVTECNYEKWKIFANKDIAENWNRTTTAPVCKQLLEEEGLRKTSPFHCKWRWTPQFAWCTLSHTDIVAQIKLEESFSPRSNDSISYFRQAKVKITAVYKLGKDLRRYKGKILRWDPLPLRLRFSGDCHPRFPTVDGHHIVKGDLNFEGRILTVLSWNYEAFRKTQDQTLMKWKQDKKPTKTECLEIEKNEKKQREEEEKRFYEVVHTNASTPFEKSCNHCETNEVALKKCICDSEFFVKIAPQDTIKSNLFGYETHAAYRVAVMTNYMEDYFHLVGRTWMTLVLRDTGKCGDRLNRMPVHVAGHLSYWNETTPMILNVTTCSLVMWTEKLKNTRTQDDVKEIVKKHTVKNCDNILTQGKSLC